MNESLSPRARARQTYEIAGAAADELIRILNPSDRSGSRKLWAFYCYHHDPEILIDKACECASRAKQGEIHNAVTAFQHWLSKSFPEGGAR